MGVASGRPADAVTIWAAADVLRGPAGDSPDAQIAAEPYISVPAP